MANDDILPTGYRAVPGTGPAGERCLTCAHAEYSRRPAFGQRCAEAMRHVGNRQVVRDIDLTSPACSYWQARKETTMSDTPTTTLGADLIGQYVIARCRDAGVHAGILVGYEGRTAHLTQARRLWQWSPPSGICLSAVATLGLVQDNSRIGPVVPSIMVLDACELILCSPAARESIEAQPEAGAS